MALIKCPECGKQISDKAEMCPQCGYPILEKAEKPNYSKSTIDEKTLENKSNECKEQKSTGKKNIIKIVAICLAIGAIIGLAILGVKKYIEYSYGVKLIGNNDTADTVGAPKGTKDVMSDNKGNDASGNAIPTDTLKSSELVDDSKNVGPTSTSVLNDSRIDALLMNAIYYKEEGTNLTLNIYREFNGNRIIVDLYGETYSPYERYDYFSGTVTDVTNSGVVIATDDIGNGVSMELSMDTDSRLFLSAIADSPTLEGGIIWGWYYSQINHGGSSAMSSQVKELYANLDSSRYLIEESSLCYLDEMDLAGMSAYDCKLARNEIYARHGYIFKSDDLVKYFNSQSWYYPQYNSSSFKDDWLNEYEKANIAMIKAYEDKGCPYSSYARNMNKRKVEFVELYGIEDESSISLYYQDKHRGILSSSIWSGYEDIYYTNYYYFVEDDNLNGKLYNMNDNSLANATYSIEYITNDYRGDSGFRIRFNNSGIDYYFDERNWYFEDYIAP